MNAKSRRIRRNKRKYSFKYFRDEVLVYKKSNFKSKKKKQKSKISVNYFCNKLKRYLAEHPESLSEFTNTWTNENDN